MFQCFLLKDTKSCLVVVQSLTLNMAKDLTLMPDVDFDENKNWPLLKRSQILTSTTSSFVKDIGLDNSVLAFENSSDEPFPNDKISIQQCPLLFISKVGLLYIYISTTIYKM